MDEKHAMLTSCFAHVPSFGEREKEETKEWAGTMFLAHIAS
jgi:hypothetical protein